MWDEASLHRLAELGIDVYVPRAERGRQTDPIAVVAPAAAPALAEQAPLAVPAPVAGAGVLVVAQAATPAAQALQVDVARALRFARIDNAAVDVADEVALANAAALLVFGETHARAIGARLPAQRQREIDWVVTGELAALAGDATAKRALWSELRRIARALAARHAVARG